MTWIAVVFFCLAEDDCKFWFKETARPMECEKTLADAANMMDTAGVPFFYGTCLAAKGKTI